ncbi:hypothetical protein HYV82_00470 [Candidatus Woesearchaeota archaeon]|nr:hypothetical protein [Candidatus Woesearchaeota archaeon]
MTELRYIVYNPGAPGSQHYPNGYFFPNEGNWAVGPVRWDGTSPLTTVYVRNAPLVGADGKQAITGEQLAAAIIYPLSEAMRSIGQGTAVATLNIPDSVSRNIEEVLAELKGKKGAVTEMTDVLAFKLHEGLSALLADSCTAH